MVPGNDFYALWLDETLACTAAKWDGIPGPRPREHLPSPVSTLQA
ncbi:hypothetical protein ACIRYZ_20225 [Kitasatospora sp. NPDC101155]